MESLSRLHKQVIPPTTSSPAIIVKHVDETQPAKECAILEEKASWPLLDKPLLQSLANTEPTVLQSGGHTVLTLQQKTSLADLIDLLLLLSCGYAVGAFGAASKCQGLSTSSGQSG